MALQQFNIATHKPTDKIVTRQGFEVRIVDFNYKPTMEEFCILVVYTLPSGRENILMARQNGRTHYHEYMDSELDLFVEEPEKWVNATLTSVGSEIVHVTIYGSKQAARACGPGGAVQYKLVKE